MATTIPFKNPYKPGAGHMPPYLSGRDVETNEFKRILKQTTILENMILTGLRGLGKTVLMDTFKPIAIKEGWYWVGTDLSETTSLSEENIANRILTDISVITSGISIGSEPVRSLGFTSEESHKDVKLGYAILKQIYENTPGMVSDKIKAVLELVWGILKTKGSQGVIFAYDEAQNLSDHAKKEERPLSLLLDVFQSIQRKDIPFMLLLTGLPTLFPKLVEARTFAERMFRVVFLDRLNPADSREAILNPLQEENCPVRFDETSLSAIAAVSGGYPYFIQFVCREAFDVLNQKIENKEKTSVPIDEITRKLDSDFFSGRWSRATDRQRDLLRVIASLPNPDKEFTVNDIVQKSHKILPKFFNSSHVNQMLTTLSDAGLIYKNRHGKYLFAVPLLGQYILRTVEEDRRNKI